MSKSNQWFLRYRFDPILTNIGPKMPQISKTWQFTEILLTFFIALRHGEKIDKKIHMDPPSDTQLSKIKKWCILKCQDMVPSIHL